MNGYVRSMAFEIKYSEEAKKNLDAITAWLFYERLAGETALRWLQGLREKIDTTSDDLLHAPFLYSVPRPERPRSVLPHQPLQHSRSGRS